MRLLLGPRSAFGVWRDNDGVPNSSHSAASTALIRVRSAAVFGAIGLSASGIYAFSGYGIPCPWRSLTHTLCPFCGATTLGANLLHGDIGAAWASNQFVFLLLVGVALAGVLSIVELLGGPALRPSGRLADQRLWYAALGGAALAFAVVRNLVPLG